MAKAVCACIPVLVQAGISIADARALRKISMTLHRWHELECGVDGGCIERDETTGKPSFYSPGTVVLPARRWAIPDREAGALKRLAAIMARYPTMRSYVQGDPRGASLYILRDSDVPEGESDDAYYSHGIAVYR